MHYLIIKWNVETLKWDIIHYSHLLEDFERLATIYPEPQHIHLIDIRWLKSHEIMKNVQEMKERFAKEQEQKKQQ